MIFLSKNIYKLSTPESVGALAKNTIKISVVCKGRLDCSKLGEAWKIVCLEHGCLSGSINYSYEYGCYLFFHKAEKGGLISFKKIEDKKLDSYRLLDMENSVSLLNIDRNKSDCYKVILMIRHSIGDGRFCLEIMRKIWVYYHKIFNGTYLEVKRRSYPKSIEDICGDNGKVNKCIFYPSDKKNYFKNFFYRKNNNLTHTAVSLSKEDTAKIIFQCKLNKTTVHGLIAAFISYLIAIEGREVNLISIVDLRLRTEEKISILEGSNFIGYSIFKIPEIGEENIYKISKKIISKIERDISCGEAKRAGMNLSGSNKEKIKNNVFVSNIGNIACFDVPNNILLEDLTVWNEMDISSETNFSVLSAYENMIFVYTFGGKLRVDFFYNENSYLLGLESKLIPIVVSTLVNL